jgi:7,8-dihydropterin-6-yl-methyl-4-(beta-D-ribofuranosyl)aminobenzene 5'-phosphate synthase
MPITVTALVENTAGTPFTIGEWGQSLLVEADGQRILFDTGPTGMITKNAAALGVDIGSVDRIVLSHGHYDHTGGLQEVLTKIRESGRRPDGIEIIAHPDIFTPKYFYIKDFVEKYIGIPFPRAELEALGGRFNMSRAPVRLSEHMLTTGEVEISVDFEKIDNDLHVKEGEEQVHDKLADDLGIIIRTEQGLVVLLGCGHRGIINTLLHAQKVTGIKEIYAVIGGTHLISADKEQMQSTIDAVKGFNIKKLGVSHCTGLKSAAILAHEFEGAFFFNSAGTKTVL